MPGLKRARTHADEFKDLEDRAPIDFDPEDEVQPSENESNDDSAPEDEAADGISARQHYQPVGKSKLRQQGPEALGPQYAGSRVTRKGVTASEQEEHDPFGEYGSDEESDVSNGGESELEEGADDPSDAESAEEDMRDEEMSDGSVTGDTSFSEDNDDEEDEDEDMDAPQRDAKDERAELRRIMKEQSNVTAAISEATRVDAEKGRALKRQRKTFDALLNTRIRMQQSLIAVNSMQAQLSSPAGTTVSEVAAKEVQGQEAYSTAEAAAMKLWNTIESLRQTLAQPSHSTKPTQPPAPKALKISTSTPTPQIWTHMQSREKTSLPSRQSTLNKWSRKTGAASSAQSQTTTPRRLGPPQSQSQEEGITSMLATHLSSTNLPRLVARTKIPRSCAPIQASSTGRGSNTNANTKTPHTNGINDNTANGTNSDPNPPTTTTPTEEIYDDADFYATLLQDLLSQRHLDDLSHASISTSTSTSGAQQQPEASLTTQLRAARAASKTKRDVDTRASKGRKMRYTVHEKLQNFMAPEGDDGGAGEKWAARQREELFGSLLGRRLVLDERDSGAGAGAGVGVDGEGDRVGVNGDGDSDGDGRDMGEEEALMLFRS